jgi:uncharacterized protein
VPTLEERLFAPGPKRILALDGGGVKGIITIAFLEKVEQILKDRSGRNDFVLSDYFDLVGGTSVGSLLATMIALGLPMTEIKRMFLEWTPQIFRQHQMAIPIISPRFTSRELRKRARELLGEATLEDAALKTGLAIITKRIDTGSPWVLTNNPRAAYWDDPADGSYLGNRHYRIADLVCASTAAPYYFAPKRIRMVPRTTRPMVSGLFIDGSVSPFNNPSLMLLMLAGIKGYKFNWGLGADRLLMVSVGTGSYRMGFKPNFLMRRFPFYFAANAIQGLSADSDQLSLTFLQWMSAPKHPWLINSEIGTMEGELLSTAEPNAAPKPFLSFVRYDTKLEVPWLNQTLGESLKSTFSDGIIEGLKRLDRPDLMEQMYDVGQRVAAGQVKADDFPEPFDAFSQPADLQPRHTDTRARLASFTIETQGLLRKKHRLTARRQLTPADFRALAVRLGVRPLTARREGLVAARQATARENVETRWNGKESQDTAAPGDWIITNLSARGRVMRDKAGHTNVYVIRADRFPTLYDRHEGETEQGAIYKAKGTVQALYFGAGFELMAPWGELQKGPDGYVILNGEEVYGNNRTTFDASYKIAR